MIRLEDVEGLELLLKEVEHGAKDTQEDGQNSEEAGHLFLLLFFVPFYYVVLCYFIFC